MDSQTASTWGPEAGEISRATFNDIDDYDAWSENPVSDASGVALTGYTGWKRTVVVSKINPNSYTATSSNASDKGLREVAVTVTSPSGKTTQLSAYRTNVAGSLQPASANATTVTWVGCSLKVGSNNPVSGGVNVMNFAEDQ